MADETLTVEILISKIVEVNSDRAEVRKLGEQALVWWERLQVAEARIVQLEQDVESAQQATFLFAAGMSA